MKFITLVTVTGADDSTDIKKLIAIAEEFPYVEFGILLSRQQRGGYRFPSSVWLNLLVEEVHGKNLNISGHLCGSWVREFLVGKWPHDEFQALHPKFTEIFKRWQINTHGYPHKVKPEELAFLVHARKEHNQTVIFQYDNVNTAGLDKCRGIGCDNIAALYDLSHGAGLLPATWPRPIPGVACGYAGGLSPENVASQIAVLEKVVGESHIWIDAETRLRTPDDTAFDLDKVRAFLSESKPFIL